jgi:predicted small secreted protein
MNLRTIVVVICVLLFTSCKNDKDEPQTLSVTPASLTFSSDEVQTKSVEITTNAALWYVEKSDEWVKYSKAGNKLFISVQEYAHTSKPRTATMTVMTGETQPVDITITQNAKEAKVVSLEPTSLLYDANEIGDKTVTVTTDSENWDATIDASWIVLSKQDNLLKVTVSEINTKSTPLIANIKITAEGAPETILTVTQSAVISLSVTPASLSFKADETVEKQASVLTNANKWSAITDASWMQLIKHNDVLRVIIKEKNTSASPRTANIKVTADKAPDFILPVTQAAVISISATPESLSFKAYDTEKTVTIETNAENWNASTDVAWMKLTKEEDKLKVKITERNSGGLTREADIKITGDDDAVLIIPVTQASI